MNSRSKVKKEIERICLEAFENTLAILFESQ